jgi:hypothetical protein
LAKTILQANRNNFFGIATSKQTKKLFLLELLLQNKTKKRISLELLLQNKKTKKISFGAGKLAQD